MKHASNLRDTMVNPADFCRQLALDTTDP